MCPVFLLARIAGCARDASVLGRFAREIHYSESHPGEQQGAQYFLDDLPHRPNRLVRRALSGMLRSDSAHPDVPSGMKRA